MAHWSTSPELCVSGTVLDWVLEDGEDAGFFHVTPFARQVIECGALKPRCEVEVVALGGGINHEAPDLVSTTVSKIQAEKLAHALRVMAKAAHGLIAPHAAMIEMLEWTDVNWYEIEEGAAANYKLPALDVDLLDLEVMIGLRKQEPADVSTWVSRLREQADRIDRIVLSGPQRNSGQATYEWLRDVESRLFSIHAEHTPNFDIDPSPVVGFTAPWDRFTQADPENVAIFQLEANVKKWADLVPPELEVRFAPEDLRIVREIRDVV